MQFRDREARDSFLQFFFALPDNRKVRWKDNLLTIVRPKPIDVRRRSAKCFEAARLIANFLPHGIAVDAVPGRLVIVAAGITIAALDRTTEAIQFDWPLIQDNSGLEAVSNIQQALR